MLKTVKQACIFNPIIRDYQMNGGIENLSQLIRDEGDGSEFFARNYITAGMEQLFREGLLRLDGKSGQAVFELTQAMGGGKTHMMVALGLLAKHPHLRRDVLPDDLRERIEVGEVRVAAFNGRNNPTHYIWGEIASQLGEAQAIKSFWVDGPKPVDQETWKSIIGDKPTLIMLDELPPYLEMASTTKLGDGTLATLTTYTLSCLMSAALELPRCCIVIANLSGSYIQATQAIQSTIANLQNEARRQASSITPVQLAGNEIYEILKKRLILEMPDESVINEVAEEYAQKVKTAADGGYLIAPSLEQIAQQVRETYPFHPAFKHLVALFKENEGFRQTRGLMQFAARLLKSVEDREVDDVFLVGAQHLRLNDDIVREEVCQIAGNLRPAMIHDIADKGESIAEEIDDRLGGDAAQQVATLLLASSLSRAVGGRLGLTEGELIEFLSAPHRKPDEFKTALEELRKHSWYLHRQEERFFIKETENLSRQIERNARDLPQKKVDDALANRLTEVLTPVSKAAYQDIQVRPKLDDLFKELKGDRTLIVIRPDGKLPPSALTDLFNTTEHKNNFMVLSGQDSYMADAVEERLRELYAIEQIVAKLQPGDSLYEEARDRKEDAEQRFSKALSGAYNRLYFPGLDEMTGEEMLLQVTIDNGLNMGSDANSAEHQIEQLLQSPRANYKLAKSLSESEDLGEHFALAEHELWPSTDRRTPWSDVQSRAKTNTGWVWMPGRNGLETLKNEALKQGRWRQGADGYLEKGPFPAEKTALNITVQSVNAETGEAVLSIVPRNAGPHPVVHYAATASVSTSDPRVDDLDSFTTSAATLYFLAIDSEGKHETGAPQRWTAELRVRHGVQAVADKRLVTLECVPDAEMRYTLDGSNPKDGELYEAPFEIGSQAVRLLVYSCAGEASRNADFAIPAAGAKQVQINDAKPARLAETKKVNLDSSEKVFQVLNTFKPRTQTTFKGVRIELGEGENTVTVRFQEREVTAAMIEAAIAGLRQALGNEQEPVTLQISGGAQFENGFDAREFATKGGFELKPGDVIQED